MFESRAIEPVRTHEHEAPFGEHLRKLRLRAGLSQAALAERAGLATAAVAALERGARRSPHPHTLGALAEALALSSQERAAFADAAGRSARSNSQQTTSGPAQPGLNPPTLPIWLTPLVGRAVEVEAARTLLDPASSAARLLTLVGPGGVGKTRLAVAVAAELAGAYQDGVMFIDLAPLHDPRLVPATIARALGLVETGGRSARELLLGHLRERHLLLLLDDMEHVAELLQDDVPAPSIASALADALEACSEHGFEATGHN
jgi:transcriptional regulator with XRE-family HTH domain